MVFYLETGRVSYQTKKDTLRLNVQLKKPTDNYYSIVNYKTIVESLKGKENIEFYGLENYRPLGSPSPHDDYVEDTYIDNSELLSDSYPPGMQPELEGFYINKGKLKLKPIPQRQESIAQQEEKLSTDANCFRQKKTKIKLRHQLKHKRLKHVECINVLPRPSTGLEKGDKNIKVLKVLVKKVMNNEGVPTYVTSSGTIPKIKIPANSNEL